jgi:Fe2+ or Zn2+ uptake regulation protein
VHSELGGLRLLASQRHGFTIAGARVVFRGLCASCSQATSQSEKAAREEKTGHV